ncbi:MAG: hypothetical protein MZW92_56770 [Comamonadaceae bacterium]|nr:hypothetical protein [Comamonadaceae bacterium]
MVGGTFDEGGFVASAGELRGALAGAGDASTPDWRGYFAEVGESFAFGTTVGGYSVVAGADYFGSAATCRRDRPAAELRGGPAGGRRHRVRGGRDAGRDLGPGPRRRRARGRGALRARPARPVRS